MQQFAHPVGDFLVRRLAAPAGRRRRFRTRSCAGTGRSAGTRTPRCGRGPLARDVFVLAQHRAGVGDLQPGDDPQQRRLARARRAQQRQQRAVGTSRLTLSSAVNLPNRFVMFLTEMLMIPLRRRSTGRLRPGRDAFCVPPATLTTSVTSASDVSSDATANEPGLLYSWNSFSTRSGMVSVRPAMWPETTYTAPNSPIARALHRMTPYSRPHLMLGSVTRQNICQPLAPRLTAAISSSGADRLHDRDQLAGHERQRHERRRQDQPRRGEDDLDAVLAQPRARSSLAGRRSSTSISPATTGDTENGRSISAVSSVRPGEAEAGDRPGRRHAENHVGHHRHRRHGQRHQNGMQRVAVADQVVPVTPSPSANAW